MSDINDCLFLPMKLIGQMEHIFGGSVYLCRLPEDIPSGPGLIVPVVDGENGLAEGWMAEGFCRGRAYLALDRNGNEIRPRLLDEEEFPYGGHGLLTAGFPRLTLLDDNTVMAGDGTRQFPKVPVETYDDARHMVLKADIISHITCDFGDILDFLELEDGMVLDNYGIDVLEKLRERLSRSTDYFRESMAVTASGALSELVAEVLANTQKLSKN